MNGVIGSTLKLAGIGFVLGVGAILHVISQSIGVSPVNSAMAYSQFATLDANDVGSIADRDSSDDGRAAIANDDLRIPFSDHRSRAIVRNIERLTRQSEGHQPDSRGPPREEALKNSSCRRPLPATTLIFNRTHSYERNPCS
jgi:hypothetical protein